MITQEGSGVIPAKVVRETFFQFNIALTVDMLEMLIRWCTAHTGEREGVMYRELVNLLDWKCEPDTETISNISQTNARPPDDNTDGNSLRNTQESFSN